MKVASEQGFNSWWNRMLLGKFQSQWLKEGMSSSTQLVKKASMGGVAPAHCQSIPRGLRVGGQLGAVSGLRKVWCMSWWKKGSPGDGEEALARARRHSHGSKADRWVWTGRLLAKWESVHLTGQPGVALESGSWLSTNLRNSSPSPVNGHVTLLGPGIHEEKHSGKGLKNGFPSSRKVTVANRSPSSSQQWRIRMWTWNCHHCLVLREGSLKRKPA